MIFTELELPGAYVVDVETHEDVRGHFSRIFDDA
jgi:dTDP-4-dehydrorhamnose 3,5-epimerase-like enzyme